MTSPTVGVEVDPGRFVSGPARERDAVEVFDSDAFLALVDGDMELARELIAIFLEDYPETLAAIENAVRTGDASALRLGAHALRGTVANFSAHAARDVAYRLEQIGRSGDLTGASDVYPALVAAVARLRSALVGLAACLAS